ncbi:hypothetical protein CYMTET_3344 [Cymbomonas tetramitiformis]|uniref:Regulatory protein RecX n=1 Tax=Cymbomonas tetramitiformis TaxID=36881 RepID=A0AAE0H3N1_9CHLO|nr:hypothetical protein CYMTET_3344 [Cymbomonas tetramitiformis]
MLAWASSVTLSVPSVSKQKRGIGYERRYNSQRVPLELLGETAKRKSLHWAGYACSATGRGCGVHTSSVSDDGGRAQDRAHARALRLLSLRMYTAAELAAKLEKQEFEASVIAAAVARTQELGLQSDVEYSRVYARQKWRQNRWAVYRISMGLRQKGVSELDIKAGIDLAFEKSLEGYDSSDCDDGEEQRDAMLRELASSAARQWRLSRSKPLEVRRRRMVGWLQRRGHDWGVVKQDEQNCKLKKGYMSGSMTKVIVTIDRPLNPR